MAVPPLLIANCQIVLLNLSDEDPGADKPRLSAGRSRHRQERRPACERKLVVALITANEAKGVQEPQNYGAYLENCLEGSRRSSVVRAFEESVR
jgi:hypothetical protein